MGDTDARDSTRRTRLRTIDWERVLTELDRHPAGTPVLVAELDQSIRTHIKQGRYPQINPALYDVWTVGISGSRTRAKIYMARKP